MAFLKWLIAGVVAGILKIATGLLFHVAIFGASYDDPGRLAVWRVYPAQMTHMVLLAVAAGLLLAAVYQPLSRALAGPAALRGLSFGILIWLGVALAATLSIVMWVNMSATTAWAWLLDSFVWLPVAGTLIGVIRGVPPAR